MSGRGKGEASRVPAPCGGIHRRASRIRQAEEFRRLVEGLAGGIIQALAQQAIAPDGLHRDQLGMPARNQQRHEGRLQRPVGRVDFFQQGSQQVAFHVVHADRRHVQGPGQRPPGRGPDQQGPDQTRPRGVGHAIQLGEGQPGLVQGLTDQGQQLAHVVTAGQLRHHPAVLGVQSHLAIERVRAQPGNGVVDRHPGFVAAGFDAENAHDSGMAGRRWESRLSGQISHLDLHRAGAGAYHTRLARDLGRKSEFRSIHA
jgi:hypothetical protein